MNRSRRFSLMAAAVVSGAVAFAPIAKADGDQIVRVADGVSYVSGGVGEASIDRLNSLSAGFNLKLVFALRGGDYLSGVKVTIADAAGKTLVAATTDGPWLLARLPAGSYEVVASFGGNAERRMVSIGTEKLRTVDFRWAP
jgi:hypothetical protein